MGDPVAPAGLVLSTWTQVCPPLAKGVEGIAGRRSGRTPPCPLSYHEPLVLMARKDDPMPLWSVFLTVFLAEFGDKTQIAMLLFAADQSRSPLGVFLASSGALVLSSLLAAMLGGQVASYLPLRVVKGVAGVGFMIIGLWLLWEMRGG